MAALVARVLRAMSSQLAETVLLGRSCLASDWPV